MQNCKRSTHCNLCDMYIIRIPMQRMNVYCTYMSVYMCYTICSTYRQCVKSIDKSQGVVTKSIIDVKIISNERREVGEREGGRERERERRV